MLVDANELQNGPREFSADVVIVGAGTVGLYLQSVLRSRYPGCRIIVVESGSRVPTTTRNATTSVSIGRTHDGTLMGRASGLGGTSALWGGQLAEFRSDDLDRVDAPWPLTFATLNSCYREVYRDLGIGVPQSQSQYRRRFGAEVDVHDSIERVFTYWLRQPNFAVVYKDSIQNDPSLTVLVNVTASGIEFEAACARRLICTAPTGRTLTMTAKSFVFAAGTLSTSRFFLSTQRQSGVPWKENRNIGLYFQDHLGGKIANVIVLNERRFRDFFENGWVDGVKLQPKLTFTESYRRTTTIGICGLFSFDSDLSNNLANVKALIRSARTGLTFAKMSSGLRDAFAIGGALVPIAWRFARQRRISAMFDRGISLHVQAEQIPTMTSSIRLHSPEPLADGLGRIAVDWRCDGREITAILDFARRTDSYLRARGIAGLSLDSALQAGDSALLDRFSDTYHQCGGLRMSLSPEGGVVDPDCRVWGTDNVWIAGAAVFPSSSFANCTLTALALAARLSNAVVV